MQNTTATNVTTGGSYTFTATNACGSTNASTANVTISAGPTAVTATASPTSICSGGPVTLTGTATGATSFNWSGPGTITDPTAMNTTATNVTTSGDYTFTATNVCGSTVVTTANLTVNTVPTGVTATATPALICAGDMLTLTGTATRALSSIWTGAPTITDPAAFTTTATDVQTSGVYTFTATNECGSTVSTTQNVTVIPLPAPPSGASISSSLPTASSLTLFWTGVSGITKYRIAYRVEGATTWQYTPIFTAQTYYTPGPYYGKLYGTVTGLQIGTHYEFALQSISTTGNCSSALSTTSPVFSTNAQTSLSCYNPTDIFVETTGANSGVVGFQVDAGTYMGVQIAYGPTSTPNSLWPTVTVPRPGSPYATQTYALNNLNGGGAYGVKLRTICSATLYTSYSNVYTFTPGVIIRGGAEVLSTAFTENPSLSVYPNPSHGIFTLRAENFPQNETDI